MRSLNSDEAFVVIEEQISGTLREELVHAEFIVGEETKIFDKILGLSQKGRLRTAIEKFLTERLVKTLVNSGGQMKNLLIFLLFFFLSLSIEQLIGHLQGTIGFESYYLQVLQSYLSLEHFTRRLKLGSDDFKV